ncbi:MAG TPA: dihydrolipoamide acetyltransferase family protein [Jatrophihabitans sp.]|jgi:pyruvate dehydrogenase E2 component (dihydrolipoamide acetyltransferase)|uniref:dihydrolipoamide acetyltransferase family protein n=1 Tax=Jatrophihabitans sp. TaxID=1932789 RepID=UPI002F14F9E5
MPDFLLPDLGEGLTDAEILTWLVAVGDEVRIDQPVVEVETAKASVEVPIPFAGRVSALFGEPGQRIPVGSPLIAVEEAGVTAAAEDSSAARGPAAERVDAEHGVAESSEYSGAVLIGYGTSSAPARRRGRAGRRTVPAAATVATSPAPVAPGRQLIATSVISPVVRKLARDRGIDLTAVRPSDPSGVIRRCDVEAFSSAPAAAAPAVVTATSPAGAASAQDVAGVERVPLVGLRRVMADKLSQSRREIPEATVWVDVDATGLLEARRALNAARPDEPVSVLALVARFCVLGLQRYRELNSRITSDAVEILPDVNLGFAAQTPRGLLVPVLGKAQAMTTRQLSAALTARTEAARAGSLTPADLTGGTFTVNNYGVFGVDGSAAIINHPEVAILGLGRIIDRPWVHEGALSVRKVSQLTLAFDHRACDGGVAGGFLRFVADCVENPVTALGEL